MEKGINFAQDIWLLIFFYLYRKGLFLLELRVREVVVSGGLYVEVSKLISVNIEHQFNNPTSKKKHSSPTTEFRKILTDNTTILKQENKKQGLKALHIRNKHPKLNRNEFESSANVLKYL